MKLKITIDIFSGRENPVIELDGRESLKFLELIKSEKQIKKAPPSPFSLGYRGLIVEQVSSPAREFPSFMQLADGIIYSPKKVIKYSDAGAEDFIFNKLSKVKNIRLPKDFRKRLFKERERFIDIRKKLIWKKIKWPVKFPCMCAPIYEPSWWNDAGQVQYNNNCYNYSANYRSDTYAQPGKAAGAMYTSLSGCSVAAGQVSAKMGAVSDCLIDSPTANNKCPKTGHLVALVIAPNWDFHWYRKGPNGYWSHKPGGTQATNLDNSGNLIPNPRTADRGPYTQFCTFMVVKHGHIKIK